MRRIYLWPLRPDWELALTDDDAELDSDRTSPHFGIAACMQKKDEETDRTDALETPCKVERHVSGSVYT